MENILINDSIRTLLIFLLIDVIFILRTRTLNSIVKLYSAQSFIIFLIGIFLYYEEGQIFILVLAILTLVSKSMLLPYYILQIAKKLKIKRDVHFDYLTGTTSILLSLITITVVYKVLVSVLSDLNIDTQSIAFIGMVVGMSLAFIGLVIIFTRRMVITDIVGYLTMENALVLMSFSLVELPYIIDILIILDVMIIALLSAILAFGIDTSIEEFHENLTLNKLFRNPTLKKRN